MNNDHAGEESITSQDGQELMFGLDFSSVEVSNIKDEETNRKTLAQSPNTPKYDPSVVDRLLLYQDNLPSATKSDFEALFLWATKQGAQLDGICCKQDRFGGRGLYSNQSVSAGGLLAILPRSLRIGQTEACHELGLPHDTPDLSALTMLVLWYCKQNHPYARCLPRGTEFSNGLLLSLEEEKSWTTLPDYISAIRRVKSTGEGCRDYIFNCLSSSPPEVDNLKTLYWAVSMVKSRSHAFGSKRGYWLTPVFDLVNHTPEPNAALEGDDQGRLVRACKRFFWSSKHFKISATHDFASMRSLQVLKALKQIEEGDEVTIDYQVDDDSMLVANYGFSLKHSCKGMSYLAP